MLFIGQADFGRLVFKRKRPAGVKVKRQRQHQRHKPVVRRDHDGVGIKSVGRGGVQLRRKPRGAPAHKAVAQIRERIPDGQWCGGGGRPHTEEHHAHAPQHKHTGALGPQHAGRGFLFRLAQTAVQQLLAQAVAGLAPHHKGQRVAVPEAGDKKHREHAKFRGQAADFAARQPGDIRPRQRHEQIILQPRRKADVPPAPEARKIRGKERRLEVLGQLQPQQQTHGPRDLGVAGEVKIQLERVKHRGQHQHRPAVAAVVREHFIHQQPQHVADGHQLKQAQCHQPQRAHCAGCVKAVLLFKLGQQRPGAADGALRDGGKKVQKQRTVNEILLDLAVAARGIN